MNAKLVVLVGMVALSAGSEAFAETCKIENTTPPDQWIFVKAYDADTGEVVLQKAIKGGSNREVIVSGERVRVDSKLPGGVDYKQRTVAVCKGGNTIRI